MDRVLNNTRKWINKQSRPSPGNYSRLNDTQADNKTMTDAPVIKRQKRSHNQSTDDNCKIQLNKNEL